jgi:ferredoxin-NADP reductase
MEIPGESSATGMTELRPPVLHSPRILWRQAEALDISPETPRVKSLILRVPGWPGHRPGQHVDVRLTAEDGYRAERSYSIASAPNSALPEREIIELTIERLGDGEVSPYLTEQLRPGDRIELRGPIGGYFTWTIEDGGPLLLIAGGTGMVPIMAMLRHRAAQGSRIPAWLLLSSRRYEEIVYRTELERMEAAADGLRIFHTLTRSQPPGWSGFHRRIDREMLQAVMPPPETRPHAYVCGPTPMVEAAATALVELGHDPAQVKTERFGPTG